MEAKYVPPSHPCGNSRLAPRVNGARNDIALQENANTGNSPDGVYSTASRPMRENMKMVPKYYTLRAIVM